MQSQAYQLKQTVKDCRSTTGWAVLIFVGSLAGSFASFLFAHPPGHNLGEVGSSTSASLNQNDPLREEALRKLKLAVGYFREQVATHGGYVYYYEPTLGRRWGEGEATVNQIWVQPPGTPAVGLAMLEAYRATNDAYFLEGVREVAMALLYGQLESGGWRNAIDFDPQGALVAQYRHGKGTVIRRSVANRSSLDDGQSQTAIRFLILTDEALEFSDPEIHEAVTYALNGLLTAQFPCGAFPQSWPIATVDHPHPRLPASYPNYDWRTEQRVKEYWDLYTLNDDLALSLTPVLLEAYRVYGDDKYLDAGKRLGDFLIAAQMPAPQPAWAQQYNYQMHPAWARRFEPPAISGSESQGVIRALMDIYRATGDERYLAPIEPCLDYLARSQLPDGRLARYYELRTNKPLYMQRDGDVYSLTYSDQQLPTHYAWKVASKVEQLRRQYLKLIQSPIEDARSLAAGQRLEKVDAQRVRNILDALDGQHRWLLTVDDARLAGQLKMQAGDQLISSQLFIDNVRLLSAFLR